MARVSDWIGSEIAEAAGETTITCSFCGHEMGKGGYWQGATRIALCYCCMTSNALPALLADAVADTHREGGADHLLLTFERNFWRSLALALRYRAHQ